MQITLTVDQRSLAVYHDGQQVLGPGPPERCFLRAGYGGGGGQECGSAGTAENNNNCFFGTSDSNAACAADGSAFNGQLNRALIGFDLGSPIHLGGRADGRADRHFLGNMALLYVYSRPISSNEAACLFYDGDSVLPATTSATACDDSCYFNNDGECDEPEYCAVGSDVTDCGLCSLDGSGR